MSRSLATSEPSIQPSSRESRCPREPASFTPLHRCVTLGLDRLECARMLLKKGADRTIRDPRWQKTPAELAADMVASGDANMQAYVELLGG